VFPSLSVQEHPPAIDTTSKHPKTSAVLIRTAYGPYRVVGVPSGG
jgi:hypothetical protein